MKDEKTKKTTNKTTSSKNNKKKVTNSKTKTTKNIQDKAKKKNIKSDKNTENKNNVILENIKKEKTKDSIKKDNKSPNIENNSNEKINKVNVSKLEDAKFTKTRKKNKLIILGIFLSFLGIIALILTLVANRLIDRKFISDTSILIMMIISIIIELFGAFIIINET